MGTSASKTTQAPPGPVLVGDEREEGTSEVICGSAHPVQMNPRYCTVVVMNAIGRTLPRGVVEDIITPYVCGTVSLVLLGDVTRHPLQWYRQRVLAMLHVAIPTPESDYSSYDWTVVSLPCTKYKSVDKDCMFLTAGHLWIIDQGSVHRFPFPLQLDQRGKLRVTWKAVTIEGPQDADSRQSWSFCNSRRGWIVLEDVFFYTVPWECGLRYVRLPLTEKDPWDGITRTCRMFSRPTGYLVLNLGRSREYSCPRALFVEFIATAPDVPVVYPDFPSCSLVLPYHRLSTSQDFTWHDFVPVPSLPSGQGLLLLARPHPPAEKRADSFQPVVYMDAHSTPVREDDVPLVSLLAHGYAGSVRCVTWFAHRYALGISHWLPSRLFTRDPWVTHLTGAPNPSYTDLQAPVLDCIVGVACRPEAEALFDRHSSSLVTILRAAALKPR